MGRSNNSIGELEINSLARNGELIVVSNDGRQFIPVLESNGSWKLTRHYPITISYQDWVMEAGPGMDGTDRFEELHRAAETGTLLVIDHTGKRLVPVNRVGLWALEPE